MIPQSPTAVATELDATVRRMAEVMWRLEVADMPAASRARDAEQFLDQNAGTINKWLGFARVSLLATRSQPSEKRQRAERMAIEIAKSVMGNDHLQHCLDERQRNEVQSDIEIEAVRIIRAALSTPSPRIVEPEARIAELEGLVERLKLEAQIHAGEAKAANSTLYEIYQLCSGVKG